MEVSRGIAAGNDVAGHHQPLFAGDPISRRQRDARALAGKFACRRAADACRCSGDDSVWMLSMPTLIRVVTSRSW